MGRKSLHTQEQVFQAADRLAAEGQPVSPTNLRTALGGGSLTTIYKHLAAWEAARPPLTKPTPATVPETVERAFAQAWQIAVAEADKNIAVIREKSDAVVKDMTQRFHEALTMIAQLESEAESDAVQIETLQSELAARQAEVSTLKTEAVARESTLIATVEQMRQQFESQQVEYRKLTQENKELIAQCAQRKGRLESLQIQVQEQTALLAKRVVSGQTL